MTMPTGPINPQHGGLNPRSHDARLVAGLDPSAAVPNPCRAHVAVTAAVHTWAPVPARIAVAGGDAAGAVATPRTPDIAEVTCRP